MISASQRPNVDTVNAASVITSHSSLATRRFKSSNSRSPAPVIIIAAVRKKLANSLPISSQAFTTHRRVRATFAIQCPVIVPIAWRPSTIPANVATGGRRSPPHRILLDMAARARTTYFVGTNIQATTVTKAAQLAT